MQERIKEIRVNIDGLYQLTKELKPLKGLNYAHVYVEENSKQIEDAAHSLIYAKAWLGKVLGELGTENPYKSGYKTVSDIEPTADVAGVDNTIGEDGIGSYNFDQFNHIEKVDWLRCSIEDIIQEVKDIPHSLLFSKWEVSVARTNAYNYLCEARFALGFELERIKADN